MFAISKQQLASKLANIVKTENGGKVRVRVHPRTITTCVVVVRTKTYHQSWVVRCSSQAWEHI